jgi:aromatic-L-amino-acid decarboxylase
MLDMTPEQFRELGYRAVDIIAQQLAELPEGPARKPVPQELRQQLLEQPLPKEGRSAEELLETFAENILPYPLGNISPRFFAWVNSPSAPLGVISEMLAAAMNSSVAGGDHSATYVEHAALNWVKTLMGYPANSGAILVSGGSMANLTGLAVMRYVKAQVKVRAEGLQAENAPMVVYTSTQGHSCIEKSVEMLGLGHDYLRKIPVDSQFRMDLDQLKTQIATDRANGLRPVCVAASAGSVNTGAVDPFEQIADLCQAEGLWFHVDGAYGGFGILAEQTSGLYKGIERADSLAVDPHKWLFVPVECGCALVRDVQAMRETFSLVPPYLRDDTALPWFSEFGFQQSRGFRALKLWMTLQQIGEKGYRELITHDVAMARALQEKIRGRADFELIAAGPLSVTCFRFVADGVEDVDALNRQLLDIVQREGRVFLTSTQIEGKLVLRACIVNFRTSEADLDVLLEVLAEAGQRVLQKGAQN